MNFSKKYLSLKGFKPVTFSVRDLDATREPARQRWLTGFLNWLQFMLQWFIRFLEFNELPFHLGKMRRTIDEITITCISVRCSCFSAISQLKFWVSQTTLFSYSRSHSTNLGSDGPAFNFFQSLHFARSLWKLLEEF